MFDKVKVYAKAIVAAIGGIVSIAVIVSDNSNLDPSQIGQIVAIILTIVGVHKVPNTDLQPYAKAIVAYGGAFVTTATMLITAQNGIDSAKLLEMFSVFVTAHSVYQVPNAPLPQK